MDVGRLKTIFVSVPRGGGRKDKENESKEPTTDERTAHVIAVKTELKKHGDNIAAILVNTNATPLHAYTDRGYMCSFCTETYLKPADLKEHTLRKHDDNVKKTYIKGKHVRNYLVKLDITGLKCNICRKSLDSVDDMMYHLKDHGKKIHFDINNHIIPFKFEGQELKCVECNLVCNRFNVLLSHMARHSRNYVCDVCGLGFVNLCTFNFHYQGHTKRGAFSCEYCSKVFDTQILVKSHEARVHARLHRAKCGYCGERFCTRRRKDIHMATVHGVDIQSAKCQICGRVFKRQYDLTNHTKRDHLLERRFVCQFCDKRFFSKVCLAHHLARHTGIKHYQCEVCKKSFNRKWSLIKHMPLHGNDMHYTCEHCGVSFKQKQGLIGHLKSKHNGSI